MEHSAADLYEMHAIVKGNVQGVGFRAMTYHHAVRLGLTGTVKNLPNGTVEIIAHGARQRLEELMKILKKQVFSEEIQEAAIEYFPIETPHEDFRIIH